MKFSIFLFVFIATTQAIETHDDNGFKHTKIDWSKVTPIEELPEFWEGRNISEALTIPKSRDRRIVGGNISAVGAYPY